MEIAIILEIFSDSLDGSETTSFEEVERRNLFKMINRKYILIRKNERICVNKKVTKNEAKKKKIVCISTVDVDCSDKIVANRFQSPSRKHGKHLKKKEDVNF